MLHHETIGIKRTFKAALLAAVSAAAISSAAPAQAQSLLEIFYADKNKYTYCDVRYLAALWKKTVVKDALYLAARAIKQGRADYVESELDYARERYPNVRCKLEDANNPKYTLDDYFALQEYWEKEGFKKPHDSKAHVLGLIQKGWNAQVIADLAAARAAGF